jgi:hypothetical protein
MYFQMRSEALKRARAVKCMAANFLHSEAWFSICLTFAFACTEKKEAAASIFFFLVSLSLFRFFFLYWEVVSFLMAFSMLWGC